MAIGTESGHPGSRLFEGGVRLRELTSRHRLIAVLLALIVAGPFVVAAFQAYADNWYPTGDNGTMLTVTRQVFTENTPLTGEVASGTRYGARPFHPGPMVYYVLAPFVEVFGGPLGLLLGAAFISVSSIVLIGYVALRTAGPAVAIWAWITALAMCWSLGGTAFLYPPFKTISALLVILLFLYLCAALVAGRVTFLPLWVLAASFPMAATMRYALPVAAVAGVTLALVLVGRWRRVGAGLGSEATLGERSVQVVALDSRERRSVVLAVLLAVLCWWAPIYEAVTNSGGNVREIYRASRVAAGDVDGIRLAAGELARTLVFDPVLGPPDFGTTNPAHVALAVVLMVAAAAVVWRSRAALGRAGWSVLIVACAATVFMLISLATIPADEGFGNYRTLSASPVGTFIVFAGGLILALGLHGRVTTSGRALPLVAIGSVVIGALVIAVPGPIDPASEDHPWAFEATRELVDEAAPDLGTDGRWAAWVIGGRTTPTVLTGFKAGLEAAGIDTGIDARAPGLRANLSNEDSEVAGTILMVPSELPQPSADNGWTVIAGYEPEDRSVEEANRVADELVDFARETRPVLLETVTQALPRLFCPDLAEQGFQGDCPEAVEVIEADDPLLELPPVLIALIYLTQFGEESEFPVLDGPKPPPELLESVARNWDDVPLTVYALPSN